MFGRRKPLSPARRWARRLVWATFAVVLVLRYGFLREYYQDFHRQQRWEARNHEARMHGQWGPRRERGPTPVRPALTEVPPTLPRFHIQIAERDANILRRYQWNGWGGGQPEERPKVLVTVREGKTVYTNVTLHLKGSAGSFRPFDDKPALTLNFSSAAKGQSFRGYSKISLNNSVQDGSYLCEIISRELFEAAGIPAPRADHATVLINGRDLGLYVLVEGFGKPFLKRHFENVSGNLYEGGFCQDIDGPLNTNSGDDPDNRQPVDKLIDAAIDNNPDRRWERLNQILDLDAFITFLALENLTVHWDGYALNRNNYRLFHNRQADRLVFLPHGMDQMFGLRRSSPHLDLFTPTRGIVAQSVLSLPQAQQQYVERIADLRRKIFTADRLTNRVHTLAQRIRPTLAAYGPDVAQNHARHVDYLLQRITQRLESVQEQLSPLLTTPPPAAPNSRP